jgi:ABC-type phosphate/phosphonate transport system substrate-binding protein
VKRHLAGFPLALALGGAVALGLSSPQRAPARATRTPVRIGLVNTLFRDTPETLARALMKPFRTLLESQTGVTGTILVAGDANDLGSRLKDNEVQLGVFHGIEFAWARLEYPTLKPLILAVNRRRELYAHLVVRKSHKAAGYTDLGGQAVALPTLTREHCRVYFERRCVPPGVTPAKFYGRVTTPPDADEALDQVVDGKAHATVVDAISLEEYRKFKPGRARELRSLQTSGAFPAAVVAYQRGRLHESTLRRLRSGLTAAHSTKRGQQLLRMLGITNFQAVPASYERLLADVARAYPPPAAR